MVFVRVSDRARKKLDTLLGYHPPYFWTWDDECGYAKIPEEKLAEAKKIKGVSRAPTKREENEK
jgi:hypothetical protein